MKTVMSGPLMIILCTCSCIYAAAQTKVHGSVYEVGAGVDVYGILGSVGGPSRNAGPEVSFTYRYCFGGHFDAGASISYMYSNGRQAKATESGDECRRISFNQLNIKEIADWNMFPERMISPFVGAGIGGDMSFKKPEDASASHKTYGVVGPRIGVQIWRFRLSADFDYAFDAKSGFLSTETSKAFCISYVF